MYPLVRTGVIACLIAGVMNLPVIAAAAKPLGMVTVAENAHLSGAPASVGTDVFTGDLLQTGPGGSLRVKFGSTQLYLTSDSNATLGQEANPLRVRLTRGRLGFSSGAGGQFEVETPVGMVRSADGQRAFGEVTILGPQKILVAAYHGSLVVAGTGIERTIPEGDAYNVTLTPDSEPAGAGSAPAAPKPALHPAVGSLAFDLVVLGVAGGLGYAAWHFTTESDTVPTTH